MIATHDGPGAANTGADGTRSCWAAGHRQGSDPDVQVVAELRRRQAAARRCVPLGDTGRRDPHHDVRHAPLTWRELDAWVAAIGHLAAHGHAVLWAVPADVRAELDAAAA